MPGAGLLNSPWLRRCGGTANPRLRLICLPYAGAGASLFRPWRLPDSLHAEVWAVQPPGREDRWREAPVRRVDLAVRALTDGLRPLLDLPYALFGHSMGALLAFELSRHLRRLGAPPPVRLFVSAFRAPHLPAWRPPLTPLTEPLLLARVAEMVGPSKSAVTDPELLSALVPLMRADFELCETYRYAPEAPLQLPVTCFAATDDSEVRVEEMSAWHRHTTGDCQLYPFTGGHLFLLDHREDVLAHVASDLAPATRDTTSAGFS
jgi:medium-chain acyl-[acyl-carrier-protein] hydrolase